MCQWQGYVGGRVQRNGGRVVCIIEELSMHYEMRTREAQVLACKNIPYAKLVCVHYSMLSNWCDRVH